MAVKTFTSEVLTSADTNTYLANSGLVYVTNATATSGTSLSVNNCFTSTYSAYRIVVTRCTIGAVSGMNMRMRASGTDQATLYYNIRSGYNYATSAADVSAVNNGTEWNLPLISDTTSAACVIDIYNPQEAHKTQYSAQGSDSRTAGVGALVSGGMLNNTTAYDGFTIYSGQTITSLNLTVYGYRKG
jgi:hypothetical protein